MNTIIVSRNGVLDTPILVKHDTTADATFQSIATELLGDDAEEVDFFCDSALDKVNHLLNNQGIEIFWFVDLEINNYKN